jgi:methionyl-tRNA formyltransferase
MSDDRQPLRFVYLTRHLNRSGYAALAACLEAGYRPEAVIVTDKAPSLCRRWSRPAALAAYRLKCWFYRCPPLKATHSEELYARSQGVRVIRIATTKSPEFHQLIAGMDLDLLVVGGGWPEKLPLPVLQLPRLGSINLHPSRLPEFRGTSITRWQVLSQVRTSAATIHYMDAEFDTGAIVAQQEAATTPDDTPQELFERLANVGAKLLVKVLDQFTAGQQPTQKAPTPDPRFDRYYSRWQWDSEKLLLDPQKPLNELHASVKAAAQESYEYPGPVLSLNGRDFIIRETRLLAGATAEIEPTDGPGTSHVDGQMIVWEREGEAATLVLSRIQPLGKYFYLTRADVPGRWFAEGEQVSVTQSERDIDDVYSYR